MKKIYVCYIYTHIHIHVIESAIIMRVAKGLFNIMNKSL